MGESYRALPANLKQRQVMALDFIATIVALDFTVDKPTISRLSCLRTPAAKRNLVHDVEIKRGAVCAGLGTDRTPSPR